MRNVTDIFVTEMKSLLTVILALTVLTQTFVNVGIGVYYHFNKQYISAKLCENRHNPGLHCNGHCFLSKQLKKAQDGESKSQSQLLKENEELIAEFNYNTPLLFFPDYRPVGYLSRASGMLPSTPVFEVIAPPKIVA
jgi:hypothetical protein